VRLFVAVQGICCIFQTPGALIPTSPRCRTRGKFPTIEDPATVTLSVIVPAYNEELRITPMLTETIEFLQSMSKKDKYAISTVLVMWSADCAENSSSAEVLRGKSSLLTTGPRMAQLSLCRRRLSSVMAPTLSDY
jgi:cellulose synthase/poly-beta-1,6-N-acetylglucosamine synthase-like glycosyltransferase